MMSEPSLVVNHLEIHLVVNRRNLSGQLSLVRTCCRAHGNIDPLPVVDGIEVAKVICRVFLRIDSELDLLCF